MKSRAIGKEIVEAVDHAILTERPRPIALGSHIPPAARAGQPRRKYNLAIRYRECFAAWLALGVPHIDRRRPASRAFPDERTAFIMELVEQRNDPGDFRRVGRNPGIGWPALDRVSEPIEHCSCSDLLILSEAWCKKKTRVSPGPLEFRISETVRAGSWANGPASTGRPASRGRPRAWRGPCRRSDAGPSGPWCTRRGRSCTAGGRSPWAGW